MKKLIGFSLALVFVLGLSTVSMAQGRFYDRRQHNQRDRIRQGLRNGEITRYEAGRLARQQAGIRRYERRAERDGVVTFRERARLDNRLDRASRSIRRQKHDRQDRW
jgi:hypothetical protein